MTKKGVTVLITDAGGRGSALVDAYAKSSKVTKIIAVPGNDLMAINTKKLVKTYPDLKTTSVAEILEICRKESVDLVDVSQDNAVAVGLVDELEKLGIKAFGPSKLAGQIEWDKSWSRDFMVKYNLPVPKFKICKSEKEGVDFIKGQKRVRAWFIKANGLVEGKGALPASTNIEALLRIKEMKRFGKDGETYLIEEWLVGEEFSTFAYLDGSSFKIVAHAQDHKRVLNFDQGENTGGMGCSTPPLLITQKVSRQIDQIFKKTLLGLIKEGRPYKGVLYLGGIVVQGEVFIIEFNARWGDPEAEIILPSIKNDVYEIAKAVIEGNLKSVNLKVENKSRVAVAGTSKGYPGDYSAVKGKEIFGLGKALRMPGVKLYSAGVKKEGKRVVANGGRLFYLVGEGRDVIEARQKAYNAMALISIEGNNLHYRTDIGYRDVERLTLKPELTR